MLDERVLRKARAQAIASGIIVSRRFKFTRRPQERESPSEDLIQCSRPFDQFLVTVRLRGRDIVAILEANVDPRKTCTRISTRPAGRLVQLSGALRV